MLEKVWPGATTGGWGGSKFQNRSEPGSDRSPTETRARTRALYRVIPVEEFSPSLCIDFSSAVTAITFL
jgi:hypothetical protein